MTTSNLLASISSVAAVWYGLGNAAVSETASVAGAGSAAPSTESTVYEVPATLRNVYPAANFNRNVTITWWATEILDGHSAEEAVGITAALKSASFVVLDQDMYQPVAKPPRSTSPTAVTRRTTPPATIKVEEDDVAVNMQFVDDWLYIAGRSPLYRVQLKTRGAQSC